MKYEWEDEIDLEGIWRGLMSRCLHLSVIGLAVVNTEQVEACLQIEQDWMAMK